MITRVFIGLICLGCYLAVHYFVTEDYYGDYDDYDEEDFR